MKYLVRINGKVWATGLTEQAAEQVARENRELHPDLYIVIEAVAR